MSATTARRGCFIGGNFKANPSTRSALAAIIENINKASPFPSNTTVLLAPTALHLSQVQSLLTRSDVSLAVQNIWRAPASGAWTGELTVDMVKDMNVHWTILGHSERRWTVSAETSAVVAEKLVTALAGGLSVVACVGEKLSDRKAGTTMDVIVEQLAPIIAAVKNPEDWKRVVIAYEPVWAIGTGVVATPQEAQSTHADIRAYLKAKAGEEVAAQTLIIYGGSVTAANCGELIKNPDIDGFLVGGAALKPEFLQIIESARAKM